MKKHTAIRFDKNNPLPPIHREIMNLAHDLSAGIMTTLVEARKGASDEMREEWSSVIANTLIRCIDTTCNFAPKGYRSDTMDGIIETLVAIKRTYGD